MIKRIIALIKHILLLSKVKITIAVSFTTITGYVLGNGSFDWGWVSVTFGIFLLACGSSVLNHIQESKSDAVMDRTSNRPLPNKEISLLGAIAIAVFEIVVGSFILWKFVNPSALLLGWIALIWYNLIYTYLKRVTPHAVIPGSVIGAIPPLVGWVAAGALLTDPRAFAIAVFFFVWQVPHFYLLVIKYGEQYEKAGMPALTGRHSEYIIRLMIFVWILTTALSAQALYYFHVIESVVSMLSIIIASLWLIVVFFLPVLNKKLEYPPFAYFMRINYYVLYVIVILNLDFVLSRYIF